MWNGGIAGGRGVPLGAGGGTLGLGGVGGSGEPLGTPREEGGRRKLNLCTCPWTDTDMRGYAGRREKLGRIWWAHNCTDVQRAQEGASEQQAGRRRTSCWTSSRRGMQGCFPHGLPQGWVFTEGRDRKRLGPGSDSRGQPAGICRSKRDGASLQHAPRLLWEPA